MSDRKPETSIERPLLTHRMYSGEDVDQAREVLSRLFTPISLEPDKGHSRLDARVNGLELPKSVLTCLEFGIDCVAGPEAPLDFHTLQLTQSGVCIFRQGGIDVPGSVERPVMLSAGHDVRVRHSYDNRILCWIVKDEVVRDLISTWTGRSDFPELHFKPSLDPTDPGTAAFLDVFRSLVRLLDRHGEALDYSTVIDSFERTLMTAMLFNLDHSLVEIIRKPSLDAGAPIVETVEGYLEARAGDPIDMPTLARETGYSLSSIYRAFQRHRGYSPGTFLADVRMRLARRRLLGAGPGDRVTSIALDCGFGHLGRFAVEYKRRFGESPKQTLDRVRV